MFEKGWSEKKEKAKFDKWYERHFYRTQKRLVKHDLKTILQKQKKDDITKKNKSSLADSYAQGEG